MTSMNQLRRLPTSVTRARSAAAGHSYAVAALVTAGALAATALLNRHLAKKAEQDNPPAGQFLEVAVSGCTTWNEAPASRWYCCMATAA
jgi:hypothetical protein